MFDYVALENFGKVHLLCADLSPAMLEEGKKRLERFPIASWNVVLDDFEDSTLNCQFDAVLLVLLLLHVDWRRGLENMLRLNPSRFYIIEQDQASDVSSITKNESLLPSLEQYSEVAEMTLVPQRDLVEFMNSHGYRQEWSSSRPVPGNKRMVGSVFSNQRNEEVTLMT
jgi:SAM-dependent methyltransferase